MVAAVATMVILPAAAQAQSRPDGVTYATKYSCLPQDATGKPLDNPNVPFICGQVDAFRSDCEMQMKLGNTAAMASHCFGWEPRHVRGGMPAVAQETAPGRTAPRRAYTSGR
ncbi:hypothetical protein [Methylobacterium nodulans]|nr:hypothetical protein [Methylobacterium nodulans]